MECAETSERHINTGLGRGGNLVDGRVESAPTATADLMQLGQTFPVRAVGGPFDVIVRNHPPKKR